MAYFWVFWLIAEVLRFIVKHPIWAIIGFVILMAIGSFNQPAYESSYVVSVLDLSWCDEHRGQQVPEEILKNAKIIPDLDRYHSNVDFLKAIQDHKTLYCAEYGFRPSEMAPNS